MNTNQILEALRDTFSEENKLAPNQEILVNPCGNACVRVYGELTLEKAKKLQSWAKERGCYMAIQDLVDEDWNDIPGYTDYEINELPNYGKKG